MYFVLRWLINTLALLAASYVVPGVSFSGFWPAFVAALIFGLINAVIRPVMIVLTLPVNLITLGFFTLVINALMFWLTASIVKGFTVTGFWPAFFGALVYWIIIMLVNLIEKPD